MYKFGVATLLFSSIIFSQAFGQQKISGNIVDATTGEPLPSAHVIIKGTYKGTISNVDGEYSIVVEEFPATLVVRFLGYESSEKKVTGNEDGPVDFLLKTSVSEMGEITVTGEDPAISIMKEVIRRKQEWRAKLFTYEAEAYTRQQLKNDTAIVSISESVSQAFWDHKKGHREVLKSRRQTANMDQADNFAGVSYMPNFYDDNLELAGFDMVGVTHPDALKYYDYKLKEIRSMDEQAVYEIEVLPKRKLQPLFEGTIFVLGEEYALLSVDLKPNAVVAFPPPVQDFNLTYSQQFSNFGGEFWLPVDVRINGLVKVGIIGLRFPPIGFKQVSKLNDYKVNVDLPDSLYRKATLFSVDSTTINTGDSLFVETIDIVPLSEKEEMAYETLDSTATLEKAFKPKGFFTRFIDWEDDESGVTVSAGSEGGSSSGSGNASGSSKNSSLMKFVRDLNPKARYNRVDAFYGELRYKRRYLDRRFSSAVFGGYSAGYKKWSYGGQLGWWPLKNTRRFAVYGGYKAETANRYNSDLYPTLLNTAVVSLGYADYYDYYRKEGMYLGANYRFRRYSAGTLKFKYKYEDHSSIDYKMSYDLMGRDYIQRFNSYADEGQLSSIELEYERGDANYKAMGAVETNYLMLSAEHSAKAIGSDWNFSRFKIDWYKRFNTFYKRRFMPNALDIRLNAGTYLGDLPVQENEVLDVALGSFTPFGAFKAKRFIPYEGASYVALNAEHNFRSVPLELLGWRDATKTGLSIIAFGGVGKTWIKDAQGTKYEFLYGGSPTTTNGWHAEAGLSLSNIFNIVRADVAYRIDEPGFYFGLSIARFF
ncbi:MAG: carboxypeptidase-like regulatory domain-containing protein [Balneolaceae bacterium]|nr:carboxypeptidase-like regulatory domain-containing protein [Balneolaceae bacterium]